MSLNLQQLDYLWALSGTHQVRWRLLRSLYLSGYMNLFKGQLDSRCYQ
jgi:hypothetical protein